jgi:hypothetical protein
MKGNIKVHIECMYENRPIELEFIREAIEEKRDRILKEKGEGCVANNTTCDYLFGGVCIHAMPDVIDGDDRKSCGSYKYSPPVDEE